MPFWKKNRKKNREQRLSPAEQGALDTFAEATREPLARLRSASQQIQEVAGRYELLAEGPPGLLGGNLMLLLNQAVLGEQLERLAEAISGRQRREPSKLADQAEFFVALVVEYATLLRVLAEVEPEPGSSLAGDWQKISEEVLQSGAALEEHTEKLELELEGEEGEDEEEGQGEISAEPTGLRAVNRVFLQRVWKDSEAGVEQEGESARLARIMQEHPEYRGAWESPEALAGGEYTIDEVNPFVHITMHEAVESQLAKGDPPETAATLERLTAAGLSRHEAVHRIATALVEQIWSMQRERRLFNRPAYLRALRKL